MNKRPKKAGFVLIELVTVLILVGIIGVFSGFFLFTGVQGYLTSKQTSEGALQAQTALERISKELADLKDLPVAPVANASVTYTSTSSELPGQRSISYNNNVISITVNGTPYPLLTDVKSFSASLGAVRSGQRRHRRDFRVYDYFYGRRNRAALFHPYLSAKVFCRALAEAAFSRRLGRCGESPKQRRRQRRGTGIYEMKKVLRKTSRLMSSSLRKSVPRVLQVQGSTLLYIVLVMVIFGMLGATVVSLFTTSTVSSTTINEDRRARYLYESAVRYTTSEMRNNGFDRDLIDDLNTTTYTLDPTGTFDFDIYSLWFRSAVSVDLPLGDPLLRVKLDEGEIPDAVAASIPSGGLYVVNIESTTPDASGNLHIPAYDPNTNTTLPNSHAIVNGFFKDSPTSYRVAITAASDNTFSVGTDERICFAVRPTTFQSFITAGKDLKVHENARFVFPRYNGVVFIKTKPVLYDEAIHYPGSRVELTNLSEAVTVSSADYVILWPANHTVIPTADTANVTYGGSANYAFNVVDTGDLTLGKYGTAKPDIDDKEFVENLNEKESGAHQFFHERDLVDKKLSIGDNSGLSSDAFGGAWYDADKSVGGSNQLLLHRPLRVRHRHPGVFHVHLQRHGGRVYLFHHQWRR